MIGTNTYFNDIIIQFQYLVKVVFFLWAKLGLRNKTKNWNKAYFPLIFKKDHLLCSFWSNLWKISFIVWIMLQVNMWYTGKNIAMKKMVLIISNERTTTTFEIQQQLLTTNKNGYPKSTLSKTFIWNQFEYFSSN